MELLDANHRIELKVYQQKVKHLEYQHKNSVKGIHFEGDTLLGFEQTSHNNREMDLLRSKEQLRAEQSKIEKDNAKMVAEVREQHERQIVKLRNQFDDGLSKRGQTASA
jgi:growth arrest-specific protein 8